jgi:hypothetical protein
MNERNKREMKGEIPAHDGGSPTYGTKSKAQPGADIRIAYDALEASLSAESEEGWGDLKQGCGRKGGDVSQGMHGEIGADGVPDDDKDVAGVLRVERYGSTLVARRGAEYLEVQGAQGLRFVAALLRQRKCLAVCESAGGVAEVSNDSDTVAAAVGACARCYSFAGRQARAAYRSCRRRRKSRSS